MLYIIRTVYTRTHMSSMPVNKVTDGTAYFYDGDVLTLEGVAVGDNEISYDNIKEVSASAKKVKGGFHYTIAVAAVYCKILSCNCGVAVVRLINRTASSS